MALCLNHQMDAVLGACIIPFTKGCVLVQQNRVTQGAYPNNCLRVARY